MTKWQKDLVANKWKSSRLSSAISNGDFFAALSFCHSLGCGRRPRWAIRGLFLLLASLEMRATLRAKQRVVVRREIKRTASTNTLSN
jgi:hypothetical protein